MYGGHKPKRNRVADNIITHVTLVVDESGSMMGLSQAVIKVVDGLIANMAAQVREINKTADVKTETRVTVYLFSNAARCVIFDMSVTDLPSIADYYDSDGGTALADATTLAIDDLGQTFDKYGKHSYLFYVITDGEELHSTAEGRRNLPNKIAALPDTWTLACLVPNALGVNMAKNLGFPAGNIAMWDATSTRGVEEMVDRVTVATNSYVSARSQSGGTFRGTKTLFQINDAAMTPADAIKAGANAMDASEYVIVPVIRDCTIKEMVEECTPNYKIGQAYYQLNNSKTPKGKRGIIVQGNKDVKVMDNDTKRVYTGKGVRSLANLPDHDITVDPQNMGTKNIVFVQSTSLNRKLYAGTKLLILTGK